MIFKVVSSLLLIVAVVCILKITPEQVATDIMKFTKKEVCIRDKVNELKSGKKKVKISDRLIYIQHALEIMKKGNKFAFIICASLALFVTGVVIAILINNVFLIPTFAVLFALAPYIYVRKSLERYEKNVSEELEVSLNIITTSYIRNGNIIEAVKENIDSIRPPLKESFSAFLGDAVYVSDTVTALKNLKGKINDEVFKEWCDVLMQCQEDSTLRDTLMSIVIKLNDIRVVNMDLASMMSAIKMEYYTMVGLVIGNIPLLYLLNKDWFHTLIYETPGKITLGVCGIVILITYLFLLKFTKPIKYKG